MPAKKIESQLLSFELVRIAHKLPFHFIQLLHHDTFTVLNWFAVHIICHTKYHIEVVLDHCGISSYFKAVYHRVDGLTKAQVMKTILNDMKLDKNQCLMVDDSIIDLTAAKENGVPFIGVSYGYGADDILDADTYTNRVTFEIKDNTVIILEGVLLFRPPIDGLIDYRIFLDVSFDEVIRRAQERDVPKWLK
jgi:hypothetical protein